MNTQAHTHRHTKKNESKSYNVPDGMGPVKALPVILKSNKDPKVPQQDSVVVGKVPVKSLFAKLIIISLDGNSDGKGPVIRELSILLQYNKSVAIDSVDGMVPPKSGFEETSTTRNFGNNLKISDGNVPCNPFEFNTMASYVCGLFVLLSSSSSLCSEQGVSKDEYH